MEMKAGRKQREGTQPGGGRDSGLGSKPGVGEQGQQNRNRGRPANVGNGGGWGGAPGPQARPPRRRSGRQVWRGGDDALTFFLGG